MPLVPSGCEHRTFSCLLWCRARVCWQWILWVLWVLVRGFHESDLFQHILQMLDQMGICGVCRPCQHLGLFKFLKLFLSSSCSVVSQQIVTKWSMTSTLPMFLMLWLINITKLKTFCSRGIYLYSMNVPKYADLLGGQRLHLLISLISNHRDQKNWKHQAVINWIENLQTSEPPLHTNKHSSCAAALRYMVCNLTACYKSHLKTVWHPKDTVYTWSNNSIGQPRSIICHV